MTPPLTADEIEALIVDAMDCAPWHYYAGGVSCSCGEPIATDDDLCRRGVRVIAAVERILAARLRVQAEQIATAIEHYRDESMLGRCRDCLYEAARIARDHAPKED